ADTSADLGMAAPDLVENGDRPQPRNALEQRHHLAVPNRDQREEPASYPAGRDRQKTRPLAGPRRSSDSRLPSGYALLSSRIRRQFLILIDARFSSRLSRGRPRSATIHHPRIWSSDRCHSSVPSPAFF